MIDALLLAGDLIVRMVVALAVLVLLASLSKERPL